MTLHKVIALQEATTWRFYDPTFVPSRMTAQVVHPKISVSQHHMINYWEISDGCDPLDSRKACRTRCERLALRELLTVQVECPLNLEKTVKHLRRTIAIA